MHIIKCHNINHGKPYRHSWNTLLTSLSSMMACNRQKRIVMDTYNKIINNQVDDPMEYLDLMLHNMKFDRSDTGEIAELSLLYCLKADNAFDCGLYDEAYKFAMDAYRVDSERKEVLHSLINVHTPQSDTNGINQFEDDEKAKEYAVKLEHLYQNDANSLCIASHCFSALGLYNDALRCLKKAYFKMTASMKQKDKDFLSKIKRQITKTLIDRYTNCPNNSHETIIKYLIELVEWKHNEFDAINLKNCLEEIWERIEYVLTTHLDSMNDENEWNKIHKLLCFIPSSIPLSSTLLHLICDVFVFHNECFVGIQFFSRLISEYQTFNDNELGIHAKFEKYANLYLHRCKLYKILSKEREMMKDLDNVNRRLLCDNIEVTLDNLSTYHMIDDKEEPQIETLQQIKKRRGVNVCFYNVRIQNEQSVKHDSEQNVNGQCEYFTNAKAIQRLSFDAET